MYADLRSMYNYMYIHCMYMYRLDRQESAADSIRKYGVGSCGPRGFYGTVGKTKVCVIIALEVSFMCAFCSKWE